MKLIELNRDFSVCKTEIFSEVDFGGDYVFMSKTPDELSLLCETSDVPEDSIEREDGWKGLKIQGQLDFGMVGVIAGISELLAKNRISIFVVSTYNTDYVFVKSENYARTAELLVKNGYELG